MITIDSGSVHVLFCLRSKQNMKKVNIFFFKEGVIIKKEIKSERIMSDEYAYSSLEEFNKRNFHNKLPSGVHVYDVDKD